MANLYTPEQLGIKAPATGFQNGSWVNGRMYFNGTFTDPGVIHPSMGGVGAGQPVSNEVMAQTNPNNPAYIQQQQQQQQTNPAVPASIANPAGGTPAIGAGGGGDMLGFGSTTPSINLPELYKSLYKDSGIETIQADLSAKEKAYNEAVSKINDNPFLSEASRVGRQQKLTIDYQNSIASLQKDVVTKKADIETQLNLQTKQFDINSQQAQLALSQFNTLLGMGTLDNASGDEIAAITRTTGLSSGMIQSAIASRRDKNIETSTISYDDGTNQGFAIINSKTGEIISKKVVAASKPSTAKATESEQKSYYANALRSDAQKGLKLGQIFSIYTGYLDPDTIYQLYNANSKWGPDKGDIKNLQKYGVTQPGAKNAQQAILDILNAK